MKLMKFVFCATADEKVSVKKVNKELRNSLWLARLRRSPLSVCVCVFSIVSHVSSVKTTDFVVKTMDFVAKTMDFWQRRRIFYFFFVFAKNPSSSPHCSPCVRHMLQCLHCILMSEAPTLSMCGHTNEGIPSTEHVHMLHWACADIIMRGNPLTNMTDNTEDANTNWQCLHTQRGWQHCPSYAWRSHRASALILFTVDLK